MAKRKAISPVIAVVILIAVAVAVSGLVSSWVTRLITHSATDNPCAGISTMYTLSGASYSPGTGELKVKLKNLGKDNVYNFTMEIDNGTIYRLHATFPPDTSQIGPGMSQYIITNATNITNPVKFTVLVSSCPGYAPGPVTL